MSLPVTSVTTSSTARGGRSGASRSSSESRTTTFSRPRWRVAGASRRASRCATSGSRRTAGATMIAMRFHCSRRCGIALAEMRPQRARRLVEDALEGGQVQRGLASVTGRAAARVGEHEDALVAGHARLRPWKQ